MSGPDVLKTSHDMSWSTYFGNSIKNAGGPLNWLEKKWTTHQPVYAMLEKLCPSAKMLEVGCGLAATSIAMNLRGFTNTALDIDPQVLELTQNLVTAKDAKVNLVQGDMFNLAGFYNKFDIVYSGGVVEHLDTTEAVTFLEEQKKVAKYIVTVIPTISEEQKAPIRRFPYGVKELVNLGISAGLLPHSVLLFKGVEAKSENLSNIGNLDNLVGSLDTLPAQRIGVVFTGLNT